MPRNNSPTVERPLSSLPSTLNTGGFRDLLFVSVQFTRRGDAAGDIRATIALLTSPSLLSWASTARKDGGLGSVNIPLYSDKNHKLAKDYGVLIEEEGIALRGLFIIDPKGTIRQVYLLFSTSLMRTYS